MADILKPLTALGHEAPETVQIGTLRIIERFDVALASLAQRRGQEAAFAKAAAGLGLPLPGPARAEAGPVLAAFWVAPSAASVRATRRASRGLRPLRREASAAARLRRAYPVGRWSNPVATGANEKEPPAALAAP